MDLGRRNSLFKGMGLGHHRLGPFAIMANHVHVLLVPSISASRLRKSLKGYTAREPTNYLDAPANLREQSSKGGIATSAEGLRLVERESGAAGKTAFTRV
jgi:hypothetical protein